MGRTKQRGARGKESRRKVKPAPASTRQHQKRPPWGNGRVVAILLVLGALAVVVWSESQRDDATESTRAGYDVSGDIVHVNNRQCAMSDSPIAAKDLGRFESRVQYDGPIERFRGKTLVFNQCCPNCIKSFPAKWAKDRDQIMDRFGLTQSQTE